MCTKEPRAQRAQGIITRSRRGEFNRRQRRLHEELELKRSCVADRPGARLGAGSRGSGSGAGAGAVINGCPFVVTGACWSDPGARAEAELVFEYMIGRPLCCALVGLMFNQDAQERPRLPRGTGRCGAGVGSCTVGIHRAYLAVVEPFCTRASY